MDNILSVELIDNQQLRSSEYFGYVYLTINTVNDMGYVGAHQSSIFDENYKGSGKVLWYAIRKYGWDKFYSIVLKWCYSKEELYSEEARIIELLDCVNSPMYYNVMPGGHGGDNKSSLTDEEYEEFRKRVSESKKNRPRTEKEKQQLDNLHKNNIGRHRTEDAKQRSREHNIGKTRSDESRKNMSINHADVSGDKNPFYGMKHTEEARSKISENNARAHKGKVWITDKVSNEVLIPYSDIDKYPGYVRGRLRKSQRRKIKFND